MRTRECAEVEREGRRERERQVKPLHHSPGEKERERESEREGDGEINENVERGDDDKECSFPELPVPGRLGGLAWGWAGVRSKAAIPHVDAEFHRDAHTWHHCVLPESPLACWIDAFQPSPRTKVGVT